MAEQYPPPSGGCVNCGQTGTLKSVAKDLTEKRRPKFGIFYVLLTLVVGLGLILWLIAPRKKVVVSVDRYNECKNCGVRQ
jgi:hypothetical protein